VIYEQVAARVPAMIPEADRVRFIAPYENQRRLDQLKQKSR
jgi:hypothetical protein